MPNCYLDRDGIFNYHLPYVGTQDRFIWHEEIIEILLFLMKYNYKFYLVTNQSGIGRGFYTKKDFLKLSLLIQNRLSFYGIKIEIRFCPHLPSDNCDCRKPKTGMINKDIRYKQDIFIGDQDSDMQCAYNAGVKHRWLVNPKLKSKFATRSSLSHEDLLKNLSDWYIEDIKDFS